MCFSHYCGSKLWPQLQDQIIALGGWFQSGGYSNEFGVKNPGVSANYSLGNHMQVSCPQLSFSISQMGQFPLTSTDFKGIQEDDSLPHNQQLWNFLCSNHTIVSFSSQSMIISFCDYFRVWAAESHCWRLVQGCLSPGFLSHTPSCLVLAEERRRIFQSIKAESLDAAQENNIAKACWWLSQSQPSRLPHNIECETT